MYLFFPPKSQNEILKLTPQRQQTSQLARFSVFLESEKSSFVPHSLDTMFSWRLRKCVEIHSNTYLISYFHDLACFFSRKRDCFDQRRQQKSTTPQEHETEWSCYNLPIFLRPPCLPPPLPAGILSSPQFCSQQETKMLAHRAQRSTSMISRKNREQYNTQQKQWKTYVYKIS